MHVLVNEVTLKSSFKNFPYVSIEEKLIQSIEYFLLLLYVFLNVLLSNIAFFF